MDLSTSERHVWCARRPSYCMVVAIVKVLRIRYTLNETQRISAHKYRIVMD